MDSAICQTSTASPAQPGGLPFVLAESLQVLPMDAPCFREWARLMEGKAERLIEDAMIAATARIHHLTIATRKERDFRQLGVQVLDPFKTLR
ncbi:MAG: PIN domain-containing protein [Terriglobales bacterium]